MNSLKKKREKGVSGLSIREDSSNETWAEEQRRGNIRGGVTPKGPEANLSSPPKTLVKKKGAIALGVGNRNGG